MIKKPDRKDGDIHKITGAVFDGEQEHLYQAGIDYCYKEMVRQFREWGFSACPHDPSNLQARKAHCPECWQILLEEEG